MIAAKDGNNEQIWCYFVGDEVDENTTGFLSQFEVKANGSPLVLSSGYLYGGSNNYLILSVTTDITQSDFIEISYTKGANPIMSTTGEEAKELVNHLCSNESTIP